MTHRGFEPRLHFSRTFLKCAIVASEHIFVARAPIHAVCLHYIEAGTGSVNSWPAYYFIRADSETQAAESALRIAFHQNPHWAKASVIGVHAKARRKGYEWVNSDRRLYSADHLDSRASLTALHLRESTRLSEEELKHYSNYGKTWFERGRKSEGPADFIRAIFVNKRVRRG